jgi:hypothetical protein
MSTCKIVEPIVDRLLLRLRLRVPVGDELGGPGANGRVGGGEGVAAVGVVGVGVLF